MKDNKTIAFVNSCFNPSKDWEKEYITQANNYRAMLPEIACAFVLVNDGSTEDITSGIDYIKDNLAHFCYESYPKNQGKGYALRYGIAKTEADFYCYTDVDFPYADHSMKAMVETMVNNEVDIVLGKRSEAYFKQIPLQRKIVSKVLILFNRYFLRLKYPDTQCGIKMFKQNAKEKFLSIKTKGFLFEVEFIKAAIDSYKISTVTVELRKETQLKRVKLNLLMRLFGEYLTFKK